MLTIWDVVRPGQSNVSKMSQSQSNLPRISSKVGFVFRDMNRAAKMRAESRSGTRAAGSMTSVSSGSESFDSASWDMLQNVMQTAGKALGAVPFPLSWNWQDQAVARFFADYILPSDAFTEDL
jgi:hypothetical protein